MSELIGRVLTVSRGFARVATASGKALCRLRGPGTVDAAPGDLAHVRLHPGDEAQLVALLPRYNALTRFREFHTYGRTGTRGGERAVRCKPEQVVAANIDQVLLIFAAAQPRLNLERVDLALLAVAGVGIPAVLCVNKADLLAPQVAEALRPYRRLDLTLLLSSALTGEGLSQLADGLRGKVTALWGPSGVGKTSLLNALEPGLGRVVRGVSAATGAGRHTTTAAELIRFGPDGWIVDTPGWRHLHPRAVSRDALAWVFPDLAEAATRCRFRDCGHGTEPGCAIRAMLAAGKLDRRRAERFIEWTA